MKESSCHEMVIHLSQRLSLFIYLSCILCVCLCFVVVVFALFISFKYDFHVDTERMTVKTRESK